MKTNDSCANMSSGVIWWWCLIQPKLGNVWISKPSTQMSKLEYLYFLNQILWSRSNLTHIYKFEDQDLYNRVGQCWPVLDCCIIIWQYSRLGRQSRSWMSGVNFEVGPDYSDFRHKQKYLKYPHPTLSFFIIKTVTCWERCSLKIWLIFV